MIIYTSSASPETRRRWRAASSASSSASRAASIASSAGRRGSVFLDRYHMEGLKSPRQTRNTLVYVLQNGRKHGEATPAGRPDPFSSAYWFDGWADESWKNGLSPPPEGACVSTPRTWLLTSEWRRHGLIRIDETPACRPG